MVKITECRTVSMRIRGVSEEGEDLSHLVPKLERQFNDLGLTMLDNQGQFLSTFEIMRQLAGVWEDLDSLQRSQMLTDVAGIRQGQHISALLKNWENVEKALETAENASGSAEREFSRAAESLNFKFNQLALTIQRFWMNSIDTDAMKNLIDGFISMGNAMADFAEDTDMVRRSFEALAVGLLMLNKKTSGVTGNLSRMMMVQSGIAQVSGVAKTALDAEVRTMDAYQNASHQTRTMIDQSTNAYKGHIIQHENFQRAGLRTKQTMLDTGSTAVNARGQVVTFGNAFKGLNASMLAAKATAIAFQVAISVGLAIAISAIVRGIMEWRNRNEELRRSTEELAQSYRSNTEEIQGNIRTISELSDQYNELVPRIDATKDSLGLSNDEFQEYQTLANQIARISPELVQGYTNEGVAILDKTKNIKDLIEALEREQELERQRLILGGEDALKVAQQDLKAYGNELDNLNRRIMNIREYGMDSDAIDVFGTGFIHENVRSLEDMRQEIEKLTESRRIMMSTEDFDPSSTAFRELENQLNSVRDEYTELTTSLSNYQMEAEQLESQINAANQQFNFHMLAVAESVDAYSDLTAQGRQVVAQFIEMQNVADLPSFVRGQANLQRFIDTMAELESQDAFSDLMDDYDGLVSSFEAGDISDSEFNEGLDRIIEKIGKLAITLDLITQNELDDFLEAFSMGYIDTSGIESGTKSLEDLRKELNSLNETQRFVARTFQGMTEETEQMQRALQEYEEQGRFAEGTLLRLANSSIPQLVSALGDEEKAYEIIRKSLGETRDFHASVLQDRLEAEKQYVMTIMRLHNQELQSFKTAKEAQLAANKAVLEMHSAGQDPAAIAAFENDIRQQIGVVRALEQAMVDIENMAVSVPRSVSGTSSSARQEYRAVADVYLELTNAIQVLNNELDLISDKMGLADEEERIRLLQRQSQIYVELKQRHTDLANAYREERKQLEALLSGRGFIFEGEGDNRTIQNLEAIEGQTREVEDAMNRYIELGKRELPSLTREMQRYKNSIAEVSRELETMQLDRLFRPAKEAVEELSKEMELLDFQLQMTESDDYSGKMDILSQQLANAQGQANFLAGEIKYLNETGFQGGVQAMEEYTQRLADLESQYRNAQLQVKRINDQMRADYERQMSDFKSQRERLADDMVRYIQDAYRQQERIIIASLNEQLRAEERAHRERIERLDDELRKYQEIIDAQLQSIDRTQDEEQFEKELQKAEEERLKIIREINIRKMDDSMEARNQVFELEQELAEQEESIAEMKNRREVQLRQQNLRDQMDAYRKEVEGKKRAENDKMQAKRDAIEAEIAMEQDKFDRLINDEERYANLRQDIINGNIDETNRLIQEFLRDFEDMNEQTVLGIGESWQSVLNMIYQAQEAQEQLRDMSSAPSRPTPQPEPSRPSTPSSSERDEGTGSATPSPSAPNYRSLSRPMRREDGNYIAFAMTPQGRTKQLTLDSSGRITDRGMLEVGDVIRTLDDFYRWDGSRGVKFSPPAYRRGGEVSSTGLAWMDGTKSEPERVLSPEQTKSFNQLVDYLPSMMKHILPSTQQQNVSAMQGAGASMSFESLIKVEGNVDKAVVTELQTTGRNLFNELKKELNKGGVFRPVRG